MSNERGLGRLEPVDLRNVWENEAAHFTPWLAKGENLSLLADTLGMDLELQALESRVGPYRADIVCKDTADGALVLIENQIAKTDHSHLGQLLTYAAGKDAITIVWVAERFTEEHRGALDWLNKITGERISFFGLEIQLWKIGNSPVAPKFNIVSKPNDWTKGGASGPGGGSGAPSVTQQLQQEYWRGLREFLIDKGSSLRPQKARAQHWLPIPIGRSNCHLSATVNGPKQCIGVELYLRGPEAKAWFAQLKSEQGDIEREFGAALDWQDLPDREATRIYLPRENTRYEDRALWPEQHAWLVEKLERLSAVFRHRVMSLRRTQADEDSVFEDVSQSSRAIRT